MKNFNEFLHDEVTVLSNEALATIKGGGIFSCYCGFVGGQGQNYPFIVIASDIGAALDQAGGQCMMQGATCGGGSNT